MPLHFSLSKSVIYSLNLLINLLRSAQEKK